MRPNREEKGVHSINERAGEWCVRLSTGSLSPQERSRSPNAVRHRTNQVTGINARAMIVKMFSWLITASAKPARSDTRNQ